MLELQLPARHDWTVQDTTYGKLTIEPFESGFGLTVGIAYRRALLSAIHGAAPTWVKIENVLHEFSHLPGVMDDTLDIMMKPPQVVFALHLNRPKILRLKAQGSTIAKAGDFEADADVEILTPDVVLATLDKDGVLEMEVCVERGRGYVSAEKREPEALPINAILLDADFSPVKRVNFHVEPSAPKAGSGSCSRCGPTAASARAPRSAKPRGILEDHFDLLTNFPEATPQEEAAERDETHPRTELKREPVPHVDELSCRSARPTASRREHPDDRRPRAEERGRAAQDQEFRQEVPERDQDDPGRDEPVARHASGSGGAGAAALAVRAPPTKPRRARLRKNAHLLRWRPRLRAQRTESTPRAQPSGAASHLDLFCAACDSLAL